MVSVAVGGAVQPQGAVVRVKNQRLITFNYIRPSNASNQNSSLTSDPAGIVTEVGKCMHNQLPDVAVPDNVNETVTGVFKSLRR
jgi:hypothetical protein